MCRVNPIPSELFTDLLPGYSSPRTAAPFFTASQSGVSSMLVASGGVFPKAGGAGSATMVALPAPPSPDKTPPDATSIEETPLCEAVKNGAAVRGLLAGPGGRSANCAEGTGFTRHILAAYKDIGPR